MILFRRKQMTSMANTEHLGMHDLTSHQCKPSEDIWESTYYVSDSLHYNPLPHVYLNEGNTGPEPLRTLPLLLCSGEAKQNRSVLKEMMAT